jgi:hypothetical protein
MRTASPAQSRCCSKKIEEEGKVVCALRLSLVITLGPEGAYRSCPVMRTGAPGKLAVAIHFAVCGEGAEVISGNLAVRCRDGAED